MNGYVVRCSMQPIHSMYAVVFKRVLLGLFVAILVAVTEGALFLLWQSRAKGPRRKRRLPAANHKKVDTEKEDPVHTEKDGIISTSTTADYHVSDLRQRK